MTENHLISEGLICPFLSQVEIFDSYKPFLIADFLFLA
jgi:hypothetical protein